MNAQPEHILANDGRCWCGPKVLTRQNYVTQDHNVAGVIITTVESRLEIVVVHMLPALLPRTGHGHGKPMRPNAYFTGVVHL